MPFIKQVPNSRTTERTPKPSTTIPDNLGQIGTNWDKLGQKLDVTNQTNAKLSHNRTHAATNGNDPGQFGANWTNLDKLGQQPNAIDPTSAKLSNNRTHAETNDDDPGQFGTNWDKLRQIGTETRCRESNQCHALAYQNVCRNQRQRSRTISDNS